MPAIAELVQSGKLSPKASAALADKRITYHDPCYLGRYNGVYDPPREILKRIPGVELVEPAYWTKQRGLCCGAGGAQMWKEEENGTMRVNMARFAEAKSTGANTVAVGCPFCLSMLSDASKAEGGEIQVKDVAEVVAERMIQPA